MVTELRCDIHGFCVLGIILARVGGEDGVGGVGKRHGRRIFGAENNGTTSTTSTDNRDDVLGGRKFRNIFHEVSG